ncbi:MAG: DNA polymerase III subunit delta [Calditrichia bacterium]
MEKSFKNRRMYYSQVMKELDSGQVAPVYLLHGEEYLLGENLIKEIKAKFLDRAEPELNFFVRYANENGLDAIISLSAGKGLFSANKLILLKDTDALKQAEIEKLLKLIEKLSSDICLILQSSVTSLNQTRLKKVESHATSVNLLSLRKNDLTDFIHAEFRKYGKRITEEALELLLFMVGTQLSDLTVQINNVAQFFGDEQLIDVAEIEKVAGIYVTQDVFEFNRLMGERKLQKAVFVLHNLLDSGVSPQQIIGQLLRHFSLLWKIQGYYRSGIRNSDSIAKELKIYPKYFQEYAEQSRQWAVRDVNQVFGLLREADRNLKNSNSDPKIILDMLSYQIINSSDKNSEL